MKPGLVARLDRLLAQRLAELEARLEGLVGGRDAADDLEQRHHLRGVEEVQAEEALGALGGRRLVDHRQRRGVGREERLRLDDRVELLPHLELQLEVLGDRLDHEVAVGEVVVVDRRPGCARGPRRRPPGWPCPSRPRARAASRSCRCPCRASPGRPRAPRRRSRTAPRPARCRGPSARSRHADLLDVRHSFLLSGNEGRQPTLAPLVATLLYVYPRSSSFIAIDRDALAAEHELLEWEQPGRLAEPRRLVDPAAPRRRGRRLVGLVAHLLPDHAGLAGAQAVAADRRRLRRRRRAGGRLRLPARRAAQVGEPLDHRAGHAAGHQLALLARGDRPQHRAAHGGARGGHPPRDPRPVRGAPSRGASASRSR